MIFKLHEKASKNQMRSLVAEITYDRKTFLFKSRFTSTALYYKCVGGSSISKNGFQKTDTLKIKIGRINVPSYHAIDVT
jgi:hypothetical protein